jgi:hypothetical protein
MNTRRKAKVPNQGRKRTGSNLRLYVKSIQSSSNAVEIALSWGS